MNVQYRRMFCAVISVGIINVLSIQGTYAQEPTEQSAQQRPEISEADPAKGKRIFNRCASCHAFDPGKRRAGPHLKDIIGRKAGAVEGFRYSSAMKSSTLVWSEENLLTFIKNPRATVPGTTMVVNVKNDEALSHLLAYLKTRSDTSEN